MEIIWLYKSIVAPLPYLIPANLLNAIFNCASSKNGIKPFSLDPFPNKAVITSLRPFTPFLIFLKAFVLSQIVAYIFALAAAINIFLNTLNTPKKEFIVAPLPISIPVNLLKANLNWSSVKTGKKPSVIPPFPNIS